jgi:hypothetical protein
MDYKKHYELLISTRKSLGRIKKKFDGLHNHHIIPKSLGGDKSKSNLVLLTPKEHFIAHLLLLMVYKNSDDYNSYRKMSYAFWNMCGRNKLKSINSKSYQMAIEEKKMLSVWVKKENKEKFISSHELEKYISAGWERGRKSFSDLTINKIRETKSGYVWISKDDFQKTVSKEEVENYVYEKWKIGRAKFTDEHKQNIKNGLTGRTLEETHKNNIGKSLKGKPLKPHNEERRKKLAKPVIIHGIKYDGLRWAADSLNTTITVIYNKLHNKKLTDCYYL